MRPRESLVQYQPPVEVAGTQSAVQAKHVMDSRLAIDVDVSGGGVGERGQATATGDKHESADARGCQRAAEAAGRANGGTAGEGQRHLPHSRGAASAVLRRNHPTGLLLLRVRDELYMTIAAYETLYDSSLTFSMRKQLQSEQGTPELHTAILELQDRKAALQERAADLAKKKDNLDKAIKDKKILDDKKRAEEIDFLKYQANHLQNFLRSINESTK